MMKPVWRLQIVSLTIVLLWSVNSKVATEAIVFKESLEPNHHKIMKIQEEFHNYQMRVIMRNEDTPNEDFFEKDGVGKLDIRMTYRVFG